MPAHPWIMIHPHVFLQFKIDETKDKQFGRVFWEALPSWWWIQTSCLSSSRWSRWSRCRSLDLGSMNLQGSRYGKMQLTWQKARAVRCISITPASWRSGTSPTCKGGSGNLGLIKNIRAECECLVGERHLHRAIPSRPMERSRTVAGQQLSQYDEEGLRRSGTRSRVCSKRALFAKCMLHVCCWELSRIEPLSFLFSCAASIIAAKKA